MSIRVLLLDDHVLFRQGLRQVLETDPEIQVVAEASTGEAAIQMACSLLPDVAVLDISLPGMDGNRVATLIRESVPTVRLLMLTIMDSSEHLHRALQAGALGYVLKDNAGEEVIAAVHTVAEGRPYQSPQLAKYAPTSDEEGGETVGPLESLTARERSVMLHLVEGLTNLETAKAQKVSERTVESARSRLMKKLHVTSIAALVKFSLLHGVATLK